jgi:ABC-type sugar transport system, permease component
MNVSERIKSVAGSKTLEINALAQSMRQKGIDVVNLTAGEPDFPTPQPIVEAAIEALKAGFTKYTDSSGIPQLREKIAKHVSERHKVPCTMEQVIVTNGGKQAIYNCLAALVQENDEVIMFRTFRWIDTFAPLTMPFWFALTTLYVFLMHQFLRGIPRELDEAAMIDGASRWQILWLIILPLCKPVIATIAVFALIQHYNEFLTPLIFLNRLDNWTMALGIRALNDSTWPTGS